MSNLRMLRKKTNPFILRCQWVEASYQRKPSDNGKASKVLVKVLKITRGLSGASLWSEWCGNAVSSRNQQGVVIHTCSLAIRNPRSLGLGGCQTSRQLRLCKLNVNYKNFQRSWLWNGKHHVTPIYVSVLKLQCTSTIVNSLSIFEWRKGADCPFFFEFYFFKRFSNEN